MPTTHVTATDLPVVRAHGRSQVRVPADLAQVPVTVAGTGTTPARALASLRRSRGHLTRVLTRFDATVTETHTQPAELVGENEQWHASAVVTVHVRDTAGIGALHAALSRLKAAEVGNPTWSLRDDHPVYAMVRKDAVRDANQRARTLAEASGSHLESLEWLHELENTTTDRCGHRGNASGLPAATHVRLLAPTEPEPQTVTVSVLAQYRIAPADVSRTNETRTVT